MSVGGGGEAVVGIQQTQGPRSESGGLHETQSNDCGVRQPGSQAQPPCLPAAWPSTSCFIFPGDNSTYLRTNKIM